jgi:hypothetical protein
MVRMALKLGSDHDRRIYEQAESVNTFIDARNPRRLVLEYRWALPKLCLVAVKS